MTTDRSPRNYTYISRRLVRNGVNQDRAARSDWSLQKINIDTKVAGRYEIGKDAPPGNDYWLAQQFTALVSDNTGTLAAPGEYVRLIGSFRHGMLPVLMPTRDVAWFDASIQENAGEKSTLIVLCGSPDNFIDFYAIPDRQRSGWYPSSVNGMDEILNAFANEKSGPDQVADGQQLESLTLESRRPIVNSASTIREVFRGLKDSQEFEVLFKVFYDIELDAEDYSDDFRRLVCGTPIWVASPAPRSNPELLERRTNSEISGEESRTLREQPRQSKNSDLTSHREGMRKWFRNVLKK